MHIFLLKIDNTALRDLDRPSRELRLVLIENIHPNGMKAWPLTVLVEARGADAAGSPCWLPVKDGWLEQAAISCLIKGLVCWGLRPGPVNDGVSLGTLVTSRNVSGAVDAVFNPAS